MRPSRRDFIAASLSGSLAGSAVEAAQPVVPEFPLGRCLDYGRSFVCHEGSRNSVRMWAESRTTVFDPQRQTVRQYVQGAACKSEDTFAAKDLFLRENYDFTPIFGRGEVLLIRRWQDVRPRYRDVRARVDVWGDPIFKLVEAEKLTLLDSWEKIRDATMEGRPIIQQTEIHDAATGLRAVIECPTKTMNIGTADEWSGKYQVDTGPVAFPDLTKRYEQPIDCLRLAYVAFNAPDFADFVIEQPTGVIKDGQEVAQVYHYGSPISLPARNLLWAAG